jgi:hypothetical protein
MSTKPKQEKSSKPEFLKQLEKNNFDINEYLKGILGKEPIWVTMLREDGVF